MKIPLQPFLFVFSLLLVETLYAQNSVDFSVDKRIGCGALSNIQFTDLSTGTVNTWQWDFGNNTTSTQQNPTASYNGPGTYTVKLTVTGPNGSLVETKNNYIVVNTKPLSNFTPSNSSGCTPKKVDFNNSSTIGDAPITKYIWDFGDGSPENNQKDPTYIYPISGTFDVSLQVIDSNSCSDTKVFSSIQIDDRPSANFSSSNSPNNCTAPHTVNFTNYTPAGPNASYKWYFGDGDSSTQFNPSHTYTSLGSYDVTLIATTNQCSDTFKLFDFASIQSTSANFSAVPKTVCFGKSIKFINQSTGASNYVWNFGDGTTSSAPNPTKTYSDSGYYVVNLISTSGSTCKDTHKDTIYVQKVIADFDAEEDTSCNFPPTSKMLNNSINGSTFEWKLGNHFFTTTSTQDTVFHFQRFTTYDDTLIAISNLGCRDTLVKLNNRLLYNPSLSINYDPQEGCEPLEIKFSYTFPLDSIVQHDWSIVEDATFSSSDDTLIYTFNAGKYHVVINSTNSRGCTMSDTAEVKVGKKYIFNIDFPDTVCAGDSIYLVRPIVDATTELEYKFLQQWDSSISKKVFAFNKDGTAFLLNNVGWVVFEYEINNYGCFSSAKDSVYVKGPLISFAPSPIDCDAFTFEFISSMIDVDKFMWDFGDGSPKDSINLNPTHTFPKDTVYDVTLTAYNSDSSCSQTITRKIKSYPPPPHEIIFRDSNVVCVNDTIFFSTISYGFDTLKWMLNDSLLSDTTAFYITKDTAYIDTLRLISINNNGCKSSKFSVIEFVSPPQIDFSTDYNGGCLPLTVNFLNNTQSTVNILDWDWEIDPVGNFNSKEPSVTINKTMVVSAKLTVTDTLGCTSFLEKDSLFSIEKNSLNFWSSKRNICLGDSILFQNFSSINDNNYKWYFGDGDSLISFDASHTYSQAGNYSVTLVYKDQQGCDVTLNRTDYITVEAKPGASFIADTTYNNCYPLPVTFTENSGDPNIVKWTWDFGDGARSTFQHPFHNYTRPGTFDVQLIVETQNGCSDTLLKPQYIKTSGPYAEINVFPDTGCINDEFTFQMVNANKVVHFQWNFGDKSTGLTNPVTYTYDTTGTLFVDLVVADSGNFCPQPIKDTIYIRGTRALFNISSSIICEDEAVQFQNLSTDFNDVEWFFGDGNNSVLENPEHIYNQSGSYDVILKVKGEFGCEDTLIKSITVNPKPNIVISPDTHVCQGDTVQLFASGGDSYLWKPSDFLSNANISNPFAFPQTTTTYKIFVNNAFNCMDSASVLVNVPEPPSISLPEDTNIIIGEYINNINTDLGSQYNYSWSPTEGLSCSNCPNPIAQPLKTTLYILNVKDPFGCYTVYDSLLIEVKEAYSLNVPNAFTPNNDGNNDIIYAKGWGIKELKEFKIFNRWGELVFETSDINTGWDGTYKGKLQDIDTYVYTIRALMYNDEIISKKGNISLLR